MPGPTRSVGRAAERVEIAEPAPAPSTPPGSSDAAIAAAAEYYLSHPMRGFRDDCSGFVCAAYSRAGFRIDGNTRSLWEEARVRKLTHRRKRPQVGDVAFFDQTYDRNGNGLLDDDLTHVAVVLAVDADGTIRMAHGGSSRGRTELYMNLYRPHDRQDASGRILNDYLRVRRNSDPPATRYLAGELWRGFARLSDL